MAKERFHPKKEGVYRIWLDLPENRWYDGEAEYKNEQWYVKGKAVNNDDVLSWQTIDGTQIK